MKDFIGGIYVSLIVFLFVAMLIARCAVSNERDKWQSACDELGIEIRFHEMSLDGVTTNWVEMIDLRNNEIRKAR